MVSTQIRSGVTRGFTLIELMIVVAIIGILSAVAIPSYQDYIKKAEVIGAITYLNTLKSEIYAHWSIEGDFPSEVGGANLGQIVEGEDIPPSVSNLFYGVDDDGTVTLYVTVHPDVMKTPSYFDRQIHMAGKVVDGQLKFVCGRWNGHYGKALDGLLPSGCNSRHVYNDLKRL